MLTDPSDVEREILEAIPYQDNLAILHTDSSLLPQEESRLGKLELPYPRVDLGRVAVTYYMKRTCSKASPHRLISA